MEWRSPWILVLVPLLCSGIGVYHFKKTRAVFSFSSNVLLQGLRITWKIRFRHISFF